MLDELTKRLAKLGLGGDAKKKSIPLTVEEDSETSEEEIDSPKKGEEEYINQIETMLKASEPNEVNRITYPKPQATMNIKPYYPRPSPINLQYEDTSYSMQNKG